MINQMSRYFLLLGFALFLSACAGLNNQFQQPQVSLVSITPTENTGISQNFALRLKIANPNAMALNIKGLSYALSLQGVELINGVSNDLPKIAAYGEEEITLNGAVNLLQGVQMLASLMSQPTNTVSYNLVTKLQISDFRLPLTITKRGDIQLGPAR